LSTVWFFVSGGCSLDLLPQPTFASWLPVLYLGVVTTALSNLLQALGQRAVPAEQAAVIFAMDPVYGALFAYAILGEKFGPQGLAGVGLIAAAAVASNLLARSSNVGDENINETAEVHEECAE
jgi:drug/metabolite transporter (DMT)-like permease